MEVNLSPISTCIPITSFISPRCSCGRSLRKKFLGNGHNLIRPRVLYYRRQQRKLSFQLHAHSPTTLMLRASLDAHTFEVVVAVVAVVAVSALTVFYMNYSKSKTDGTETKILQILRKTGHSIIQDFTRVTNWVIQEHFMQPRDLKSKVSVNQNEEPMKEAKAISPDSVDFVDAIDFVGINSADYKTNSTLELTKTDAGSSLLDDSLFIRETEGQSLSSSSLRESAPNLSTSTVNQQTYQMHLEGTEQPSRNGNSSPVAVLEKSPTIDSFTEEVNKPDRLINGLQKEGEQGFVDLIYRDNTREELYSFYEAHTTSPDLGELSSKISVQGNGSSSMSKSPMVNGVKVLGPKFSHHSEDFEGQGALAFHKGGSDHRSKNMGEREILPAYIAKGKLHQKRSEDILLSHDLKGKNLSERHQPSQKFGAYNRLLRDGRLTDSIELLEDMESKGLLDMDKVYHAGFFRVCRSQKAVKQAFRFTKLIPNPTLSTFNMLMSVCANSRDLEGAFQVLKLVMESGLKADCKLYTTLVSTCAKSGKVDTMFKVFHEMVNAGVEPNIHTYSSLIDGCAKAGQVAKAFGVYGIMSSKNVKPDRVVYNALISACGESGAVDRAFDVLEEMRAETEPIDPDHVTLGALMKACAKSGQVDRAREVYKMIDENNMKGTPEVYTIAVNSCSQNGDWEFACKVYNDMTRKGVAPDETFISALIDVAGHADMLDAAFEIIKAARAKGIHVGIIAYASLMGACTNAKDWQKALQLYEHIKEIKLKPTVSMMNALVTALCDANELQKAIEILFEMKRQGLSANTITYSVLLVASEKNDDLDVGLRLHSQAKKDGVASNAVMRRCLIDMCLRRFQQSCSLGEPVVSLNSRILQLDNQWTSLALKIYRETIVAGVIPTVEELSLVLGCLKFPLDLSIRNRLIEDLGVSIDSSKHSSLYSLIDGFGEYDPRAFSLVEEAASLGIVPTVSLKQVPIVVDLRNLQIFSAEVYLLTVLRGLKHRLAAGARLPNLSILLPLETTQTQTPAGEKTINLAGRVSQAVAAMLRRLGISYIGNESREKIRINGVVVRMWLQPKLDSPFGGKPTYLTSPKRRLGNNIEYQQRNIRTGHWSLE